MAVSPYSYTVELRYDGAWNDITADVDGDRGVNITRGAKDEQRPYLAAPGTMRLRLNNGDSAVASGVAGRYDYRNANSDLYGKIARQGTLIRVTVTLGTETSTRFVGEVIQWPTRRSHAGGHAWVDVEAAGILRRLGAPRKPLRSALRRYVANHQLSGALAYWPMEDQQDASRLVNLVPGGSALQLTAGAQKLAAESSLDGSSPLPAAQRDSDAFDQLRFTAPLSIPGGLFTLGWWSRARFVGGSGGLAAISVVLRVGDSTSDIDEWTFGITRNQDNDEDTFRAFGQLDGSVGSDAGFPLPFPTDTHDPGWRFVRVTVDESGGDVRTRMWVDETLIDTATDDIDPGSVHQITVQVGISGSDREVLASMGHLLVIAGADDLSDGPGMFEGGSGHSGEAAGRRIERLCEEEGITLVTQGDLDETLPMGPQRPGQLIDLLAEAAKLEAAGAPLPILGEARDQDALRLLTRRSLHVTP